MGLKERAIEAYQKQKDLELERACAAARERHQSSLRSLNVALENLGISEKATSNPCEIEGINFIYKLNEYNSRDYGLFLIKVCEECEKAIWSFEIRTLIDLGRALNDENWQYHRCPDPAGEA